VCAHCGQHASKLHIHELPPGNSSVNLGLSSATIIQNVPTDPPLRSSISLEPPQSPINVRSSPIPSPDSNTVSRAVSNASHRQLSLSPYHMFQPPWDRSYNEKEPYIIDGGYEYPLPQGQGVPHPRSFSDPAVALEHSRTPSKSPQPCPSDPPDSRISQRPQHVQAANNSLAASTPSSPQRNSTGSPYRAPTQLSQPRDMLPPTSPTPPLLLQPNHYRPPSSGSENPRPGQSSLPAFPSLPKLYQPDPTRPSHIKPAQPAYPSQLPEPAYPSQSSQPTYPSQNPQPPYPTTPTWGQ
jgi:hypothetical protein